MSQTALLIIDLQNDYFPGGAYPLVGTTAAAANAGRLLEAAREAGHLVVHVRHVSTGPEGGFFLEGTDGAEINPEVAPLAGEPVVVKYQVNAFLNTGLDDLLRQHQVRRLTIVGAMSHMCVDAATRAALDLGYEVTLVHDATATRDLEFGGATTPAAQVQTAMMAALAFAGAQVVDTPTAESGWR